MLNSPLFPYSIHSVLGYFRVFMVGKVKVFTPLGGFPFFPVGFFFSGAFFSYLSIVLGFFMDMVMGRCTIGFFIFAFPASSSSSSSSLQDIFK